MKARCPVREQQTDVYEFVIESPTMIKVEDILDFFACLDAPIYQEDLTRQCAQHLGARVRSTGWHSGVKTVCEW